MTINYLSEIAAHVLGHKDLSKLKARDYDNGRGHKKAILSIIPYVGGTLAEELQQYYDYKDDEFFRKFVRYLIGMKDTTGEERQKLIKEIEKITEDFAGNVICGMVDRLDNINKEAIFANLSIARIEGKICIEDFFRLHTLLERIPYVDLVYLNKYQSNFYDDSGDTELLYSTGALVLSVIDPDSGNKYRLSVLGQKLLEFGMGVIVEVQKKHGTFLKVESISRDVVESIIEEKQEEHKPRIEGSTLILG